MTYSGRFNISAEDNKALGETFDAVNRVVDEAFIELDGGIRVVAVDPENTFSVEAEIPQREFDQYGGEEGRFAVSIDALSTALSNINKTDGVRIEVDGDAREVLVDGGGEQTTLDMLDPDNVRDAPDLGGNRKGEGGVKTMDYTGKVTVPDKQFRRVVRVSNEVSDRITLGIASDGLQNDKAFKTLAEGDVDDVFAYPDAEIDRRPTDDVGGLFSLRFIDSMTLATPKRATDLEIAFPGQDVPVRFNFTTGGSVGGDVTFWIAPRMPSNPAETDSLDELREYDTGATMLESPNFRAKVDGSRGKQMFDLFGTFVDEYKLAVTDEGIETRAVDPSNVAMRIINVDPGYFDLYSEVGGWPEKQVGLAGSRVEGVLKKWTQSQPVEFMYDGSVRKIELMHPIFSVRIGTIDPDSIRQEPDIPEVDMTAEVDIDPATYVGEMQQVLTGYDVAGHVVSDNQFWAFGEDDDVIENPKQIPAVEAKGVGLGRYSTDYIGQFFDTLPVDTPDPMEIRIGTEFPLGYEVDIAGGALSEMVTIAPRVVTDDRDLGADVQDAIGDSIDLSWVNNPDEKDRLAVDSSLFKDIETKSITQRKREERLSTFPIESTVETGFSGSSTLRIEDAEDMAVEEVAIDGVKNEVKERIEDADVGSSEKVADVTFTDELNYNIEYVPLQPDTARRFNTEDGVRFRDVTREQGNYLYYSARDETPARYQLSLRAVDDDGTIGFKLGYKPPRGTDVAESFVDSGFDSMLEAYDAMIEYADTTTTEEMVREAGIEVEMTNKEVGEMVDEITDTYVDWKSEIKPANDDLNFYISLQAQKPLLPDATWRGDVTVERPDEIDDPYEVRYSLSYRTDGIKDGDGVTTSGRELAARVVGYADSRADIEPLVGDAFDELQSFGEWFARTSRQQDAPAKDIPSPREGDSESVIKFAQAFLPSSIESITEEVAASEYPVNFTDISGVGPARSDEIEELGVTNMVDLTSTMASNKSAFWVGQTLREFPDDARQNIREAAGNIWANIIWPKRTIPGDYPRDLEDATPTPDGDEEVETTDQTDKILDMFAEEVVKEMEVEEIEEFVALPDGYNENQWDVAVIARPDADFGERMDVQPLDPAVRRNPDLEITDDVIDSLESSVPRSSLWQYEDGDVVALAGLGEDVRRGAEVRAFTMEPGHDLLLARTTDNDGNLDVEAGEWVGIHPKQLLDNASVGDLQAGWQTAPINDTNPGTFNVGWDGGRHYHYRELRSPPYFVYEWDTDTNQPEELMDDTPTRNYAAINVTPPGEEVIGLVRGSDQGPKPQTPVYASEYADEYDLDPFLQSADDAKQLADKNRDVLMRTPGGEIIETEAYKLAQDGAGFTVRDTDYPDGVYYIPSSNKESTLELVGVKSLADTVALISTNRPLTMQAQDTLQQYGVVEEITAAEAENPPLGVGDETVVGLRLEDAPPVDVTERLELRFQEPVEVWESDREGKVYIYRDRVRSDESGQLPSEPEDAARLSRENDEFRPVDVPDDSPFAGLEPEGEPPEDGEDGDDDTFEVDVGVEEGIIERIKINARPSLFTANDPNDIAGKITERMKEDLTEKELVRYVGRLAGNEPVAVATVRGGEVDDGGMGVTTLNNAEELVDFEWLVDFPSVDQEPSAGEINDAYPALNMPKSQTLTDFLRSVDDLLNFTPAGLEQIENIGEATTNNLTDGAADDNPAKTIGELREESDVEDEEQEPDVSITDILNARRIGQWSAVAGDIGDEVVLLVLDDGRTVGIRLEKVDLQDQDILESFGLLFDEPVDANLTLGGIPERTDENVVASTRLGDVTFRPELIEDHLEENTPASVRAALEPDEEPDDTGTDATDRFREVVSEARDVLDQAEELVAEGELRREGEINNLSSALTQLGSFDVDPETLDTEAAMNAIDAVESQIPPVRDLVENPDQQGERGTERDMTPFDDDLEGELEERDEEPDEEPDDDGELNRDEIKRIVEAATEGVTANPIILNDDLQRIRLEIEPATTVEFESGRDIVATRGDTREAMTLDAIQRWGDVVDISTVDTQTVNDRRMQISQSETVDIGVPPVGEQDVQEGTTEESEPTEEPEPEPDVSAASGEEIQQELREELAALGLPTGVDAPVDITFEETGDKTEPNILQARHNPPSLWADILESDIPPLQGQDDSVNEFVGGVIERIINATDFSKVDVGAINARRERLNEKYDAEIPLLRSTADGDEEETPAEPGEEADDNGGVGVETHLIKAVDTGYAPLGDVTDAERREVNDQTEAALGDADQFDPGTTVGEAFIDPDGEVAVRVAEGERILDAQMQQEDIEERTPEFDMDAPLTAQMVRDAFPRLLGDGQAIANAFDTLGELANAPLSEVDDVFGVGEGTLERMVDTPDLDMTKSVMEQRDRPLGIEEAVPDPSPTPDVVTGDEVDQLPGTDTDGPTPGVAVSIPPTAPAGEKWLARQIEQGNRLQPNRFQDTPIVEIVFPKRIAGQVRNVVANNDISRGGQTVTVQNPSFRDEIPKEAASLKSIQFMLRSEGMSPATNLRSSGFDIQEIVDRLSDKLIVVTKSPLVAASITFETNPQP